MVGSVFEMTTELSETSKSVLTSRFDKRLNFKYSTNEYAAFYQLNFKCLKLETFLYNLKVKIKLNEHIQNVEVYGGF